MFAIWVFQTLLEVLCYFFQLKLAQLLRITLFHSLSSWSVISSDNEPICFQDQSWCFANGTLKEKQEKERNSITNDVTTSTWHTFFFDWQIDLHKQHSGFRPVYIPIVVLILIIHAFLWCGSFRLIGISQYTWLYNNKYIDHTHTHTHRKYNEEHIHVFQEFVYKHLWKKNKMDREKWQHCIFILATFFFSYKYQLKLQLRLNGSAQLYEIG